LAKVVTIKASKGSFSILYLLTQQYPEAPLASEQSMKHTSLAEKLLMSLLLNLIAALA